MFSAEPENRESANEQSLLYQIGRNAYRVLGLPADASWRAISERGAALNRAAKAGIPRPSPWNFEWYGSLRRDGTAISDALGRLSNPYQRLRERFFWIAQSEIFVTYIPTQGLDASIESLRESYSSRNHHDAAVLALISCVSGDPQLKDPECWRRMLELWVGAIATEDLWSELMGIEESGDFEPAAACEDHDKLRAESLKLIREPVAELARDAASRGEFERCGRALQIIRAATLPPKIVSAAEEDVLGSYEDSFNRLSKEINRSCWSEIKRDRASTDVNKKPCSIAVERWQRELEPRYHEFVAMAGFGSVPYVRVTDEYADFLERVANALTWAELWARAEDLLIQARDLLLTGSPARERIETRLRNIAEPAARQRLAQQPGRQRGSQQAPLISRTQNRTTRLSRWSIDRAKNELSQSIPKDVSEFVELCGMIWRDCWQQLNSRGGYWHSELGYFEAGYCNFKRLAAPRLATILNKYRQNRHICVRARNAAAKCLRSLAGGMVLENDLVAAYAVASEALALVLDDKELEDKVKVQLEAIAKKEQRRLAPKPAAYRTYNSAPADDSSVSRTFKYAAAVVIVLLVIVAILADSRNQRRSEPASASIGRGAGDVFDRIARDEQSEPALTSPESDRVPPPPPGYKLESEAGGASTRIVEPSITEFLPEYKKRQPVSLPNGTNLTPSFGKSGLGSLRISNYSEEGAALKLKTTIGDKTILCRFVDVRAMKDLTISGISPGEYLLQFTTGKDWDRSRKTFRENQEFSEFENPLSFSGYRMNDNSIEYSVHKITLHTVPNGNVHKKEITAADFDDGSGEHVEQKGGNE